MSKLPPAHQFLDLSDYGRPLARAVVRAFEGTRVSSIHLTWAFLVAGVGAIVAILAGGYEFAAACILAKNVLDAADGEMARVRKRPSHTGRYLDSVFDYIVNGGLVVAIAVVSGTAPLVAFLAFLAVEFQGTIYNYYYLIQRRIVRGDRTSRINEFDPPEPFAYDNPKTVRLLHRLYLLCYAPFDRLMLVADDADTITRPLPNWFLTSLSAFGLGSQLLVIAVGLVLGLSDYLLPFLCFATIPAVALILVRKYGLATPSGVRRVG